LNLKPKQLNLSQDLASRTPFRGVANFSPVIAKDKGKKMTLFLVGCEFMTVLHIFLVLCNQTM
jgi:hypothetical protein